MVVFPDGVRVFRGKPGSRHQLPDFVKLTDTKRMASSDRKLSGAYRHRPEPCLEF